MGKWLELALGGACVVWLAISAVADEPLQSIAPDLGFTVQVPDRDWTCEPQRNGYRCHPRDRERPLFIVTVTEPSNGRLGPSRRRVGAAA
jgi:hypothetical protein